MFGIVLGVAAVAALGAWGAFIYNVKTVERPAYEVVEERGAIELRDYPPLVVAEVTRRGSRWEAVRRGFRPLANYIFAKSRGGEPIAMTSPVTQSRPEPIAMTAPVTQSPDNDGAWTVRFIMPSAYSLETLPAPPDGVRLAEVPARRVAAIQFSGYATDESLAEHERELLAWLETRDLQAASRPTYAYYDDPWTPGPLRRNEVLVEVAAR